MARSKANNGGSKEPVSITIQQTVLTRLDRFCLKHDFDRSQVIGWAVKNYLAAEMAKDPAFWESLYDNFDENVIL